MPTACYDPATGGLLGTERSLFAIYTDLNALTNGQKNAIWTDFTSGSPPKWSQDGQDGVTHGFHAGEVSAHAGLAIDMPVVAGNWTTALQTKARLMMVAVYMLDRPKYLVAPSFDATINIQAWS